MPFTRRQFLQQTAAVSAAALTRGAIAQRGGPAAVAARLTLHPDRQVATVSPHFMGLGYEISSVTRPGVFGLSGDYVNLVRSLGPHGVIRVGGNTADFASFSANGAAVSSPKGTVVTQADLDRLRQFLGATGWKLIWSVNLGSGTGQQQIEKGVEEAVAVSTTMGEHLLAVEIGNEPDLFFIEHRPKPYAYEQFRSEFVLFRDALLKRLPNLPLAGPDVAGATDWVRRFAQDEPRNLQLLTHHYYREGQNPTSSAAKLLGSDPKLLPQLEALRSVSQATGLPYRICEVNSFSGGGRPGVSDSFASALWVLDYMLLLASDGCSGVNMETGVNQLGFVSSYSPIFENADGTLTARPELYGMLAFSEATAGEGTAAQLIACDFTESSANATAYVVRRSPDQFTAIVINKDLATDLTVTMEREGRAFGSVSVVRLVAPALNASSAVTLGGRTLSAAGTWSTTAALERSNGSSVFVPRASAAIVTLTR